MHETDDIKSIISAINEINLKPKKKLTTTSFQKIIPKLNQELLVSPDIDKIIKEAEAYKKNLSFKDSQSEVILNREQQTSKVDVLILKDEVVESLEIPDPSIDDLNEVFSRDKNHLKDEVVSSLKIQDTTILLLQEQIKKYKDTEEKLRFQIIDLEQDNTLLLNKSKKNIELETYETFKKDMEETLKSIYAQVKNQKKIFLNLKVETAKIKGDSNIYKENYERLIIENNNIKIRLDSAKEQIAKHETNKLDLLSSINQLNEVLSKTNIVTNIPQIKEPPIKNILKEPKK